MATCDSFQQIFEKPLPENPTLIEALTQWNRHQMMKARKPIDLSSFCEIFGELHFHEKNNHPDSSFSCSSSSPHSPFSFQSLLIEDKHNNVDEKEKDNNNDDDDDNLSLPSSSSSSSSSSTWSSSSSSSSSGTVDHHNQYESFSSKSSESLQLCTEGLGSESADDVEDSTSTIAKKEEFVSNDSNTNEEEEVEEEEEMVKSSFTMHSLSSPDRGNINHFRRESYSSRSVSRTNSFVNSGSISGAPSFPPPISSIGRSGKPWVCFRSYRRDGRFVLKEIRIPTQEFLSACREDGRLRLHFVQPDEEIPEEEEEEEVEEEKEDEEEDNVVDEEVMVVEKGEPDE